MPEERRRTGGAPPTRRCPYFPTKLATDPCGRCRSYFSAEALAVVEDVRVCPKCSTEIELAAELAEAQRWTRANFFAWLRSPRAAVLGALLLFLALIIGGGTVVFINLASTPLPYETIRRARVGFTQDFSLDGQGISLVEAINGGGAWAPAGATRRLLLDGDKTVIGLADQLRVDPRDVAALNGVGGDHKFRSGTMVVVPLSDRHTSARLVDGLLEPNLPGWQSGPAQFPLDLVFWSEEPFPLEKVVIWNHELEEPASFIAEFEVYAAPVDPRLNSGSLELLGAFESPRTVGSNPQFVEVDPERPETRWYVLRVLSNHGLGEYISAAEIGLFGPEPEGLEPVEDDG